VAIFTIVMTPGQVFASHHDGHHIGHTQSAFAANANGGDTKGVNSGTPCAH